MGEAQRSELFAPGALSGQVALVTGGGTGLGLASALELARCGAEVVLAGRRPEVLAAAAETVAQVAGDRDRVSHVDGDIRRAEDAARIVAAAHDRHGRLDVLVNNAGGQYFVPAESISDKGWNAVWRLNYGGTLSMCRAARSLGFGAPGRPSPGTIVNVTFSPHHGLPGMTHSGSARAAVEAMTAELAREWAAQEIAVIAVAAGHFETEALDKYPAGVRAGAALSVPLGRLGRPEEHAWLVAFLATPAGRHLSGSTVTLDGARDNWFGPWPPPAITDESGAVPTEERRPPG